MWAMQTNEKIREMRIKVPYSAEASTEVSALFLRPPDAESLLVLAHGAGAGMKHPFMSGLANELAPQRIATLRYQFPYIEQKRRAPDRPPVLTATVEAAVAAAGNAARKLPLFAGGKSLGGRMTSTAASETGALGKVRGLIFFGFPLHPPNQPGTKRAEHLHRVKLPMLFLQGTRDALADLNLLRPIMKELGAGATLEVFEGADHSFHMPKSSDTSDAEMLKELAQSVAKWTRKLLYSH